MTSKPKLGQNFLIDASAIERIAGSLGDLSARTVVEIGPGAGAITRALALRAGRLIAIELDEALAARLRSELPGIELVHRNVLDFDFAAAAAQAGQPLLVFGNLPYYITSPILLGLARYHTSIDRAVLMVQSEVASRVTAQPGSRDYGLLSVMVQLYGPAATLFSLPPSAFLPSPKVHSTVFRWRFHARFAELGIDPEAFVPFLRAVFAQKRKTLVNNLRAAGYSPAAIASALAEVPIPATARAEQLAIDELANLFRALEKRALPGELESRT